MDGTIYSTERASAVLLAAAGMALQWASLHTVTFLGSVFPAAAGASSGVWSANSVTTLLMFALIYLTGRRAAPLLDRRRVPLAVAACLAAGCALVVFASFLPSSAAPVPAAALFTVASVLLACGTTPLIVMWGETFRYLNPKNEQLLVTLGGIVCSVALYMTTTLVPTALAAVLFVAMPLGSLACLVKAWRVLGELSKSWGLGARSGSEDAGSGRRSPALLYVCIVAFSVPYNFLRDSLDVQQVIQTPALWTEVLAVTVVIMLGVTVLEVAAEHRDVIIVPGAVLFLLLAAMLVHLLPLDVVKRATPFLLYAGYYLFLAMVYLALGPVAAASSSNPTRLFSGAMVANVGGLLIGSMLGLIGVAVGDAGGSIIVLAVMSVILLTGFALFSNRSFSVFRVNYFDEDEYSFEYLVPPTGKSGRREPAGMRGGETAAGETVPGGIAVGGMSVGGPAGGRQGDPLLDAILARCSQVRKRYKLSDREYEVLAELVRGRTIATIAEQLVVSENTVKAHTKAIYRKVDVHTREGLLALVGSMEA